MVFKMKVIKNPKFCELTLINGKNDVFLIHYAVGVLYWTMYDYYEDNEFIVSNEDDILFIRKVI